MLQLTTTIPSASHEKTSPMDSWSYGSYVHVEPASSQPWSSGTGTPVTSMDWDQNALYHGNPAVSNVASPESAGGGELKDLKSVDAPPPRKRISRACDQCNQLRTKCDGDKPCAHCICGFETPLHWPVRPTNLLVWLTRISLWTCLRI